jgi:hypothetical protein
VLHEIQSGKTILYGHDKFPGTASINVLLNDTEGNIWAGSKSGLLRTPGVGLQFITNENGESSNILSVTVDSHENVWYSTYDGLYKRTLTADGNVALSKPLFNSNFDTYTVISLYTDKDGFIWAGLYGEGVLRIDPLREKIIHLNSQLRNGNILSITGNEDEIWLSTLGGSSRIIVAGENFTVNNFSREEGLSSDFIYQVLVDSKDRVWFATDGKGVDMKDERGIHHFEQGLPSKVVYSIIEDGAGKIWANVQGNGLYVLNNQGEFEAPPSTIIVRDNEIHSMRVDKNGNIVLMHDAGMDIIDIKKQQVRYLGDESGLRDMVGNLNASGSNETGSLFFGTNNGVIQYQSGIQYLTQTPIAIIDEVKIFDKTVQVPEISKLSYDQSNLTFNYVGLWYQSPENVFFLYKLENYDRDWIPSKNTSVTYSHLPPGKYTFKVKVSDTEDFGYAREASLPFVISPPFWRTPIFYILSIIIFIVGAYLLLKYRERKLIRDKLILEHRVKTRTVEVQRQNDEIQAQNEEIMAQAEEIKGINENLEMLVHERTTELERKNKALEEYAFINAHKLRSPVASILGLVNLFSKIPMESEGKEIRKHLQQSTEELDGIVRKITKAIESGENLDSEKKKS